MASPKKQSLRLLQIARDFPLAPKRLTIQERSHNLQCLRPTAQPLSISSQAQPRKNRLTMRHLMMHILVQEAKEVAHDALVVQRALDKYADSIEKTLDELKRSLRM